MEESIVMLVIIGILIIALAISFIVKKNKDKKNGNSGKSNVSNNASTSKKSNDGVARKDMSEFIKFDKIANDMIYQKKGEKYTMAIECKGINYDLMSEVEQMSIEEGFIKFLNTLKTPIQLYVQTRSVNLADNIKKYRERTANFEQTYSDMISKYNDAEEDIDVSKEETENLRLEKIKYGNIAEYASDITKYVERMSLNKFMLQRKYYILISYYKSEIAATEKFTKEEYEELCYRELYTKAQGIISSLTACSIKGRILNSNELAELIYISYNRDDQKNMDIKRALESGFYRLYTTSPDVRQRRNEMLDEEIRKAANERIQQAIEEGFKNGTLVSEEEAKKQIDKRIDKEAMNIINESDMSKEAKEKVKDLIVDNRKKRLANEKKSKEEKKEEVSGINIDDRMVSEDIKEDVKSEANEEKINSNVLRNERIMEDEKEQVVEQEKIEPEIEEKIEEQKIEKKEENKEEIKEYPSMNDEIELRENLNSSRNVTMKDELNLNDRKNESIFDDGIQKKETKAIEDDEDDSIV